MAHSYDPYENVRNVMSDAAKMAGIDSPYMEIIKCPQRETKVYLPVEMAVSYTHLEGIFNRYRADGFHPLAQLYSYCEAAGRQQNGLKKEEKEGTIVVENTGAYERYQYLPYGVDFSSIQCLDTLYRDLNLQKKFWSNREDEKNTYKICMIDEDSLLKTAGVDWQK